MTKQKPLQYQQLDGKTALKICSSKEAQALGVEVRSAKGDHFIVTCPRLKTTECIPYNMNSNGVKHSVWRFLKVVGLIAICIVVILGYTLL